MNEFCPNEKLCAPQIIGKIAHFVSKKALDIKYIGVETIEHLFQHKIVQNVADLYILEKEQFMSIQKIGAKLATKILSNIEKSKHVPFYKVFYGLGIKNVGETVSQKIVQHYPSIDELIKASIYDLSQIPDIGSTIANSIVSFFQNKDNIILVNRLKKYGIQMECVYTLSKIFVFTGILNSITRIQANELVYKYGGKIATSISKKVDFLVVGDKPGNKLMQAKSINSIKILNEQEFLQFIK